MDDLLTQQLQEYARVAANRRSPSASFPPPTEADAAEAVSPVSPPVDDIGGDDPLAQQLREYANIRRGTAAPPQRGEGSSGAASPAASVSSDRSVSTGALASGLRGAVDTATFGFADEAGGAVDTLRGDGNPNASFAERLAGNIALRRQQMAQDQADHPIARGVGQLYGALALPVGAAEHGALAVAKVGAAQGAAYGLGSGGDTGQGTTADVVDRAKSAAEGGVVGGIVGGVIGKVSELASPYVNRALSALRGGTVADEAGVAANAAGEGSVQPSSVPVDAAADTNLRAQAGAMSQADTAVTGDNVTAWGTDPATGQPTPILSPKGDTTDILAIPHDGSEPLPHGHGDLQGGDAVDSGGTEAPDLTEGGAAHAGTIDRGGLQGLQDDVAAFRERVANGDSAAPDINPATDPEAASRVGNFRLGNLGNGDDTANLLGAISRQVPTKGVRNDAELMATAKAAARDMGEDPEAVLATAHALAGKVGDADNTMAVLRTVWAKAASDVSSLHLAGIDWSTASDEAVASAASSIRNLSQLSQIVQTAKVGLGRGLRVNSLPDAETYLAQLAERSRAEAAGEVAPSELTPEAAADVRNPPPLPGSREEMQDWMDRWGALEGDPKAQADYLQGLLTVPTASKYLRTSFANFFVGSVLSGIKTLSLDIAAPGVQAMTQTLERMAGGALGALNPLSLAADRAASAEVARATPIAYLQTFGDIGDAFRFAVKSAEAGRSIIGGGGVPGADLTVSPYGPLTANLLEAAGAEPGAAYTLGNLINVWPKAVMRLHVGAAEFAKRLAYNGEVRAQASIEAAAKGLSGNDAQDFVRQRLTNAYDPVGAATDDAMLFSAQRTTMTGPVGNPGGLTGRFANSINALRSDIPELRYILPVFNVTANTLGETLRRLPITRLTGIGPALFPETAAELAGERGPVAQAEAHGRFMLGSAFLTAGVMLNRAGLLTGAGPQNPVDRSVWLNGHQPYSIRVGDEWVRYDKFAPIGGLLSIPATIADATTYRPADQGVGDMMMSGAGALAQWFKDRSALMNASSLLSAGDSPTEKLGPTLQRTGGTILGGFVPRVVQDLGVNAQDPYLRMKRTWGDYMKAAIPGLSQQLEPVRNVLGEPVNRSADTFAEAVFPVVMAPTTSYAKDPVMDELDRMYRTTGYAGGADPKAIGYGYFNPKDVKLEDGRSIYDHAMQDRQTMRLDGKTLRETLKETIDSPEYNAAVDADSGEKQTSLGDDSRGYMLKHVFDTFNQAIKSDVASRSPLADKWLTAAAAKQRDDAYLRATPIQDLVNNPDLYATHGIDPSAYSEKIKSKAPGGELAAALGLLD